MLSQPGGQEPRGYGEIFVMRARQMGAVLASFVQRGGSWRNRIAGREAAPAQGNRTLILQGWNHGSKVNTGLIVEQESGPPTWVLQTTIELKI